MTPGDDVQTVEAFVAMIGAKRWVQRLADIEREAARSQRVGRALVQWHAIEIMIERLRRTPQTVARSAGERAVLELLQEALRAHASLSPTRSAPSSHTATRTLTRSSSGSRSVAKTK